MDRAIQSVVDQTYRDIEIILVDDGSTDESGDRCEEWAKKDERIRVVHKKNGGLSSARNAGMEVAKGEFYSFPDSDDYIDTDYLEKMVKEMENPDVTLVCAGFIVTNLADESVTQASESRLQLTKAQALEDIFKYRLNVRPSACNKLYRKELFEKIKFNENVVQEDTEAMPRIIDSGKDVVVLPDTFYHYIKREGSISVARKFNMMSYRFLDCFKEYEKLCADKYPDLLPIFYFYEMQGTFGMIKSLVKSSDARKYLKQELTLRLRVIRYFLKARKYEVNVKEHGHDMIAMAERSLIGLRLSRKLFNLPD